MTEAATAVNTPLSLTGDYTLDPTHTRIGFSVRHAMVSNVKGQFGTFSGTAHLDEDNVANSYAEVDIDVASITTGNDDRDNHLRTSDFFDAEKFPKIVFKATGAEQVGEGQHVLRGDLTIKDVTRPIEVHFEEVGRGLDPWGGFRIGFEGSATISRKDWGLTYNMAIETGGVVIADKVKLEFDVEAVRNA